MAVIGPANPDDLIRASWGQAVADELNLRTVKNNVASQTVLGPITVNGAVTANASPGVILKAATEQPYIRWASLAGTPLAYVVYLGPQFKYDVGVAGGSHLFTVNEVEVGELSSSGLVIPGNLSARAGVFARNDDANQIVISDYDAGTAGDTAHAFIAFFPDATSATVFGTRGGYVGYNGTGFQVQSGVGNVTVAADGIATVSSTTSGVVLEAASVVIVTADGMYIGKTAFSDTTAGTHIFTSTVGTTSIRDSIRNTVATAGSPNVYLRRMSAPAMASGQVFFDMTVDTPGTRVGFISKGTGDNTVFNAMSGGTHVSTSDYRYKDDLGPVADPIGRVRQLQPKHLRWKPGAGAEGEFDGFLAHEVTPVAANAVVGEFDAVLPADHPTDPGGIDPQGLDEKKLVPLLTAALQEALDQIDALTARVAALEGTP